MLSWNTLKTSRDDPKNVDKMAAAIGRLMIEKAERAQDYAEGGNSAASIFGRRRSDAIGSTSGECSDEDKERKDQTKGK
ncbi:MAG: hypothetical protein GY772_00865, partial [bacterium]|nr:hypothetical protein [bacterium]